MATTESRGDEPQGSIPTAPPRRPPSELKRDRAGRRAIVSVLAAFVVLGMAGLFGSRTDAVSASGGGYTLTVVYPRITRPGLPDRWIYTVRHPGGFDRPVVITTTMVYLNLFDLTGIQPDASSQTSNGTDVVWTFDQPDGDLFSVQFDAATETGIHEVPAATAAVVVDGRPVVQVQFRTVVIP
jgi:hypothetical protein